jgi:N-acetylmuramoyl-L-alanine amidase
MMSDQGFTPEDSSLSISELTELLHRVGYLSSLKDSDDQEVVAAVRALQQDRGLKVTGECDLKTIRALEEARWKLGDRAIRLTSPMMRGDDVATLQNRLLQMGFDVGRADGIFGLKSERALKEFQKSSGVASDGVCNQSTVIALMRLIRTVAGGGATALREDALRHRRGPALRDKVIVLDPSWGGKNPGHSFGEIYESEFTFDLAQRLSKRLVALGVVVEITREKDFSPSEIERIEFANQIQPDLVISLHSDNYKNEKAEGVASFYYGSELHGIKSLIGERFANLAQREISARTGLLNCRTHAKGWDLLRLTKSPTVRIDIGYLSNPLDREKIIDPNFRDLLAESLVIAIQRLYLSAESDAKTGTLRIEDLRKAGIRP